MRKKNSTKKKLNDSYVNLLIWEMNKEKKNGLYF